MTLTVKIFLHVKNILTGISYYFVYNLMKKYEHITYSLYQFSCTANIFTSSLHKKNIHWF